MNEFYFVNDLNEIIDGYNLEGAQKLFSYALKAAESAGDEESAEKYGRVLETLTA